MTTATLVHGWQRDLPASTYSLPGGFSLLSVTPPTAVLARHRDDLRAAIVAVADQAFGRATAASWDNKFSVGFLGALARFYLIAGPDGGLVGWSGYRARTFAGERVVYFTSTGLLPRCQGLGLIPSVQRLALADEGCTSVGAATLAIRTRNPQAYRLAQQTFAAGRVVPARDGTVPLDRRPLLAAVASWLGMRDVDAATGIVPDAYPIEGGLYGQEPHSSEADVDRLFSGLDPQAALLILVAPAGPRHEPAG